MRIKKKNTMNKKGLSFSIIWIILAIITVLGMSLTLFTVYSPIRTMIQSYTITTGAGASNEEGIYIGENISTSDPKTIDKSSQANNFIKYCIGIAGIIFAISALLGVIYIFYKEHNRHMRKK